LNSEEIMDIYIVRHAIAEDIAPGGGGDAARALTTEGKQKMKEAARGFARMELNVERIFASPLVRARQTADILAAALKKNVEEMKELAPAYSPAQVCEKLIALKKAGSVMLVGHEPNCSELASYLLEGSTGVAIEFKKGAICLIELESPRPASGMLRWLLPPSALRLMNK
jgi:phosphohistidine phosphatase